MGKVRVRDANQYISTCIQILRKKIGAHDFLGHVLILVSLLMAYVLLEMYVDQVWILGESARVWMLRVLLGAMALGIGGIAFFYLRKRLSPLFVVHQLETEYPQFKNALSTYLYWQRGDLEMSESSARPMVNHALKGLTFVDSDKVVLQCSRIVRPLAVFICLVLAAFFYCLVGTDQPGLLISRALLPGQGYPPPTQTRFEFVSPKGGRYPSGTRVTIKSIVTGRLPRSGVCTYRPEGVAGWRELQLAPTKKGHYQVTLPPLLEPTEFQLRCGDGSSAIYLITPIAPLVLSKYRITVTPPAYTGLSPVIEEDQGSMVFPLRMTLMDWLTKVSNGSAPQKHIMDPSLLGGRDPLAPHVTGSGNCKHGRKLKLSSGGRITSKHRVF